MSLFMPCLGVIGFSCHIRPGGFYSCSGCREGICIPVLVQYRLKSNICTSFPYQMIQVSDMKLVVSIACLSHC